MRIGQVALDAVVVGSHDVRLKLWPESVQEHGVLHEVDPGQCRGDVDLDRDLLGHGQVEADIQTKSGERHGSNGVRGDLEIERIGRGVDHRVVSI